MAIKIFQTEAQYEAATLPTDQSTVSHITDTNEIEVDGVMVLTTSPKKGDICCLDADGKIRFFTLESYDNALLPSGWTAVAPVARVMGSRVRLARVIGTYKYANYYLWKVTGWTADGASYPFSFAVTVSGTTYTCSGSYSGNDINEVAASMNTIVKPFDFGGHKYHVYVRNGLLILQHDTYTAYLAVTPTGVTVTAATAAELIASSALPRRNGNNGADGALMNMDRACIYFRSDSSNNAFNPNTTVTSIERTHPVVLPGYLGTSTHRGGNDYCQVLRDRYGAGEAGWMNFMRTGMQVLYPLLRGILDYYQRGDGKKNTYLLAGQTAEDHDGATDALYPVFDAAAAVAFGNADLAAGKWFVPYIGELFDLLKDVDYPERYKMGTGAESVAAQDADAVNRALYKLGLTQIGNNVEYCTSSRSSNTVSWSYGGNLGCTAQNAMFNSRATIACVDFTLPQAD